MNVLVRFLYTLDLAANVIIGGSIHETMSARAHRTANKDHPYWGWTEKFINGLFFWQKEHCKNAYLGEQARGRVPTMNTKHYVDTFIGMIGWLILIVGIAALIF